ncbi:hypothetical protein [Geodermatophilus sp. URMC 64]
MTEQPNNPYGQSQPYGQQPQYGAHPQYPASPHGQQQPMPYGQYSMPGGYGQPAPGSRPAKPGGVVTAAVLGFIFGALGALVTILFLFVGAVATGGSSDIEDDLPGFGEAFGFLGGALIVVGILALVWTVLMIWGSVWALTGRSRVLLLVGGSIALAFTAFGFFGNLANADEAGGGSVVTSLLFFLAALAIVILLSVRAASQFFATHRALRGR